MFFSARKICLGKSLQVYLAHNIHKEYCLDCLELKISEIIKVISAYHGYIFRNRQWLVATNCFTNKWNIRRTQNENHKYFFESVVYSDYQAKQLQYIIISLPLKWIQFKDRNKSTPLHLAAENGHSQMLELLLANGADVTIEDSLSRNIACKS